MERNPLGSLLRNVVGPTVFAFAVGVASAACFAQGPAAPAADVRAADLHLLEQELALEHSLEGLVAEADSIFLVPDFDDTATTGAPALAPSIDGRLDDGFWATATSSFVWTVPGDSRFRAPVDWRFRAALIGGALYLAGSSARALDAERVLSLRAGKDRLTIVLPVSAPATVRLESSAAAWAAAEELGFRFAVRVDSEGASFELRVPRANELWAPPLGALRPLHVSEARGRPAALALSPAFTLLPGSVAARVESTGHPDPRMLGARVRLSSFAPEALVVETGLNEEATLAAGGELTLEFTAGVVLGSEAQGWSFRVGAAPQRVAMVTGYRNPVALREGIRRAYEQSRRNVEHVGASGPGLAEALARVRRGVEASVGRTDPEALERLYFEARALQRESFLAGLPAGFREVLFLKRYHYRTGPFYTTYRHEVAGGNVSLLRRGDGAARDLLELPAGASVRDLALDFDATQLVFSQRVPGGGTHLYRARADGSGLRQLTDGPGHDLEAAFLADGRLVFTSTRHGAQSPINDTENLCLHVTESSVRGFLESSSAEPIPVRRLSFNNLVDFTPSQLPDGRILFLRWSHDDKPGNFVNALWAIYPDGRGVAGVFGMNREGLTIEPQPIFDTGRVVCLSAGANGQWRSPLVGAIGVIATEQSDHDFAYRIEPARGGFKNPFPVSDDVFLVSHGWIDTRWALYLVDRFGNRELLYRDPEYSCFNPMPLAPRPRPNRIPDLSAGDPSVPATLFVQDVRQGLPGVGAGRVKALRVVAVPDRPRLAIEAPFLDRRVPTSVAQRMIRRDLGTVPVAADGSVYFDVPANTNVFFQLLDERGYLVQTMRDTTHFAPGERRSCIGCHEARSSAPARPAGAAPEALRRPPARPDLGGRPASIDFPRDIQPILERHCVRCHDAADPAGGVILSGDWTPFFNLAYETLTAGGANYNFQNRDPALVAAARSGGGDEARSAAGGPPAQSIAYGVELLPPASTGSATSALLGLLEAGHHGVALEPHEGAELARWIDLNLPYRGDWEAPAGEGADRRLRWRLLSPGGARRLEAVLRTRCRGCHPPPDLYRGAAVNLTRPETSPILTAPLPRSQGGTGRCRWPVFRSRQDPQHALILEILEQEARGARAASSPASPDER